MRFRVRWYAAAIAALATAMPLTRAAACTDFGQALTTRWSLETVGGASWLVTPCGQRFLSLGVNALDGGYPLSREGRQVYYSWTAFAPTQAAWVDGDPATACELGL